MNLKAKQLLFVILMGIITIVSFSCKRKKKANIKNWPDGTIELCEREDPIFIPKCKNDIVKKKVFVENDKKWLWGGENDKWHFNITNWCLNECQLKYGLGRESFKALIFPNYISIEAADTFYNDEDRFMVLRGENETKVYSISLLTNHEVINDTIDGHPIMPVYCVLADLAAVYDRKFCNRTLTFGVSGYTYADPQVWKGVNGFIIWDRDTESLWWPLIDKAVSGPMKGAALVKYDSSKWNEITWGEIKIQYPEAKVLEPDQSMDVPTNFTVYSSSGC